MSSLAAQVFFILLVVGLVLIGAEIFVPGGILGFMGGAALLGAIVTAFVRFGPAAGGYITIGIVVLVGIVIFLWAKYFPRTALGRKMTVSQDLKSAKGTADGMEQLIGRTGVALSDLRPGGFAKVDGRRLDVITEGEMLSKGDNIVVADVESNRIVVRKQQN